MPKPLTLEEAVRMPRGAFHPLFSPDGSTLLYEEDTAGEHLLGVWDVALGSRVAAIPGRDAAWSPDGESIAYVLDGQVVVSAPDGESAAQVGTGGSPRWHPRQGVVLWEREEEGVRTVFCRDLDQVGTGQVVAAVGEGPWAISADGRWLAMVETELPADPIPWLPEFAAAQGLSAGRPRVVALDLHGGGQAVCDWLPWGATVNALAWSPDGSTLAYGWELVFESPGPYQRGVHAWGPPEGDLCELATPEGPCLMHPAWSPDGRYLAVLANPWGQLSISPNEGWLTVLEPDTWRVLGQCRNLRAQTPIHWRGDGNMVCCRTEHHAEQPYTAFSVPQLQPRRLTPEGQFCSRASLSPDGRQLAVSCRAFSGLNEIWLCPTDYGNPSCLTASSASLQQWDLPKVWTHHWSNEGLELDGIVVEPMQQEAPAQAPLLLFPWVDEGGWTIAGMEPPLNLAALVLAIAGRGYRVLIPSNRLAGLVGCEQVNHADMRACTRDVTAGVRSLRERLGSQGPTVAFGHSIGSGYVCEMLGASPDLLQAAVISGAYPDLISRYSFEFTPSPLSREALGGPPWQRPVEYVNASPMRHVSEVAAPVLIMMGEEDWGWSAMHYFVALQEAGKDVTYLEFQGQDHWPEKDPERVVAYLETALRWLGERLGSPAGPGVPREVGKGDQARGAPEPTG